ncbi:MAG: GntR family transcriptional regulator [Bacteroidaceae bacterium]|nr:GntR family transcriptional regulator [Bacteroidaceae bacterium]
MIKLGQYNLLTINRFTDHGAYLDAGKDLGEILLPKAFVKSEMRPGTQVEVIVYFDQQDRLVATTEKALACVGDFAHLRVAWVNEHGAFLHWGPMKDIFVPFREQKLRMVKDHSYLVHIHIDEETARIVASAKIERYIENAQPTDYHRGEVVDMLIWQKTDLGFKVIVNNRHQGLIYDNQVYTQLHSGMRLEGSVVKVRPDGKIDLSVQRIGKGRFKDFAEELLEELKNAPDGFLPFTDKTASDDIVARFGQSKKTFKKAVGMLYRERLITIEDNGIRLNQ